MIADNNGTLYVLNLNPGGGGDIFYSTNNGQNWKKSYCNCGIQFFAVDSLNFLFGGTGNGVIRTVLPVSSVWNAENEEAAISSYPNPSSGKTTIRYTLERSSDAILTLYDSRGMQMLQVSDKQPPGVHEISVDVSHLPNGMYYYRLEADGHVETKKMLISK